MKRAAAGTAGLVRTSSATRINAELQQFEVGMVFPAGSSLTEGFKLAEFEQERGYPSCDQVRRRSEEVRGLL
jgi:hypothetical protein